MNLKTHMITTEKELQRLLLQHDMKSIESALVQIFLSNNNLSVRNNVLLLKHIANNTPDVIAAKHTLSSIVGISELSSLVNIFELLIPAADKRLNGAFFTPKFIADYMVKETITAKNVTICDPSCGCGAFLASAIIFLHENYHTNLVSIIENNIFGIDILDYSIRHTKILMSLLAINYGEDVFQIKFNLEVADSLSANCLTLFGIGAFDIIIGNPPYVRFQDLSTEMRKQLNTEWTTLNTGNFNLYFAFFELGVKWLSEKGVLAYINPNNYFTSLAGIRLREYLANHRLIDRILDFNHLKVFKAQAYTCITLLKKKSTKIGFDRIDDYCRLKSIHDRNYEPIEYSELNNKKWRLLKQSEKNNIRKIETAGLSLGEIADVRVGIATCKDVIYFVDGANCCGDFYKKTFGEKIYYIEKNITVPIVKISDFKSQKEMDNNKRRIIFPYRMQNNKV